MSQRPGLVATAIIFGVVLAVTACRLVAAETVYWIAEMLTFILGGPARWEGEKRLPFGRQQSVRDRAVVGAVVLSLGGILAGRLFALRLGAIVDSGIVGPAIGVLVVVALELFVPTLPPGHPYG